MSHDERDHEAARSIRWQSHNATDNRVIENSAKSIASIAKKKLSSLRSERIESAGAFAQSKEFRIEMEIYERLSADPRMDEAYSALMCNCTASQVRCFAAGAFRAACDAPGFNVVRDDLIRIKKLRERIARAADSLINLLCEAHELAGLDFNICGSEADQLLNWPRELFHPPNVFHREHFSDLVRLCDRRRSLYQSVGLTELADSGLDLRSPPRGWTVRYKFTEDGSRLLLALLNNCDEIVRSSEIKDCDDLESHFDPWMQAILQDVELVEDLRNRLPQNLWIISELLSAVKAWSPETADETVSAAISVRERNRKMQLLRAFWRLLMEGIEWEQGLDDSHGVRRAVMVASNVVLDSDEDAVELRNVNDVANRYKLAVKR